jgi:hypothetical protein
MNEGEGISSSLVRIWNGVEGTRYAHTGLGITRKQTVSSFKKETLNGVSLPLLRMQHLITLQRAFKDSQTCKFGQRLGNGTFGTCRKSEDTMMLILAWY